MPKSYPLLLAALTLILLGGGAVRAVGLSWGLPYQLHPDEPVLFISAWEIYNGVTPTIQPDYPPLYIRGLAAQRWLVNTLLGPDTSQTVYFFWGRWNALLFSLLLLAVGYRLGRLWGGVRAGLALMLFLAAEPIAIDQGMLIKADVPAWTFALAALWVSGYAPRTAHPARWLALAVALAGLATLTKYNMAFVFLAPLFVGLGFWVKPLAWRVVLFVGGGVAGIGLAKYTLSYFWVDTINPRFAHCSGVSTAESSDWLPCGPFLAFQRFLHQFYYSPDLWTPESQAAWAHLRALLDFSFGYWWVGLALALPLVGIWVRRESRIRPGVALLLSMAILIAFLIAVFGVMHPERQYYLLWIALGALFALGLSALSGHPRAPAGTFALGLVVMLAPILPDGLAQAIDRTKPDTRALTAEYLLDYAGQGETVVVEYDSVELQTQYGGFQGDPGYFNVITTPGVYTLEPETFFQRGIHYVVTDSRAQGPGSAWVARAEMPPAFELLAHFGDESTTGPVRRIYRTFQPEVARFADFGGRLHLAGYDATRDDETLYLTFYWQAQDGHLPDYSLFIHLWRAEETSAPVRQFDAAPTPPTRFWRDQEWILDERALDLSDLPPGDYQINIGWYVPEQDLRLPVQGNPAGTLALMDVTVR